jgi:hypothetical protein
MTNRLSDDALRVCALRVYAKKLLERAEKAERDHAAARRRAA